MELLDVMDRNGIVNDRIVSSFFTYSIRRCKEFHPQLQTAAIFSHLPLDFRALSLDVMADALFLRKDIVSQALVEECHKNGFTVNIWNEDKPEEIRKYAEMGPDMMSSNFPDRLKQIVATA
jgi:glycerophosphoryl diester phosphodiesterase